MYRTLAVLSVVAVGATAVYAQNLDAIKARREAMQAIATAGSANFGMMQGKVPFDLATVQANLKMYQEQAAKFKGLFPEDSKTGGNTDAKPKIWQSKAEFDAANDNFITVVKAAAAAITDEASLKTEYPKVISQGCNGCHKDADGFSPPLRESFKKPKS